MSRTHRGSKGPGYDYWASRLSPGHPGEGHGAYAKRRTHRRERQKAKAALRREQEPDTLNMLQWGR